MKKQIRKEYITVAAIFLVVAVIAVLWFLISRIENFGTISSQEVDEILYRQLDEYVQAYEEDPGLAQIFTTALTNPDELTAADRQAYLTYERKFFIGWEVAWTYYYHGYFDGDRYSVWDSWFVDEFRRRPSFVWTENRKHFPEAFVKYVDDSAEEQSAYGQK